MECPQCHQKLRYVSNDESNNPETGDIYDRKVYVCDDDGIWVTVEVPKQAAK